MKLTITKNFQDADTLMVPGYTGNNPADKLEIIEDPRLLEILKKIPDWDWKFGDSKKYTIVDDTKLNTILLIGLGKEEDFGVDRFKKAVAKGFRSLEAKDVDIITFCLPPALAYIEVEAAVEATAEAACLTNYEFVKYKSDWKSKKFSEFQIMYDRDKDLTEFMASGEMIARATNLSRDLVNEPANFMDPVQLAAEAMKAADEYGFEVEIKDEVQIKELGMKAFMEVARGSAIPPRLIIMRYKGNPESKEVLGLVGKGLTYDSGGYSLKTATGMFSMKCDMGGSAAVMGAMSAIAGNKLKLNVVTVIAACENMLSAHSYRPGDIIGSMGGKTIEVMNTDAEGRLTLVDAVTYIQEIEKVSRVVDIATLTGGAVVSFAKVHTPVISNNDNFYKHLETASADSGEKIWRMPFDKAYVKMLKSPIADLKNTASGGASMITAGMFISEYINDVPWMHIDIAGKALDEKAKDYTPKGATGLGTRLLYNLAKQMQ